MDTPDTALRGQNTTSGGRDCTQSDWAHRENFIVVGASKLATPHAQPDGYPARSKPRP